MKIIAYHLGIELTQKCNLNCSHCFRGEMKNTNITKEILEKIFDEIKYVNVLDLSGGEVFLGYEQLKMLLEIAKEKGTTIDYCSMLTNGTIYDQRIYDLLDEYFGDNYQVAISNDDFHDKSIQRIYSHNLDSSKNPFLYPRNINDIKENMLLHLDNPHNIGFQRVSRHLINNGRAKFLDTPKKEFEAIGYYYSYFKDDVLLVGPIIFIGADGYISDINSDIEKRNIQSIGNILNTTLSDSIIKGGIKTTFDDENIFAKFNQREIDFATHQGDHLIFKDNKMYYTDYTPDLKYNEAIEKFPEDLMKLKEAILSGDINTFFDNWDPIYDGDLSQIEHKKI